MNDEKEAISESEENAVKEKSKLREALEFLAPIAIALVIAMVLKIFVFANAVIPTGSMLNTIQEGDRVFASKIEYTLHDPERYDIAIFKYPDNENEYFVKRVIGLPGETVNIRNGEVYVTDKDGNTEKLRDDFVSPENKDRYNGTFIVPEDSYFVMGDNRASSVDSRYWNTTHYVSRDKFIGKVKLRYYPFNSFGWIK
ncbi:signal peptidase I [uncultured Eubacterium sp.]|uniref:signal peptidase I n=1 Tax=uncultured Eubacterium sp. TaxID=165185 RepID=UPI0015AFD78B|nr:signal peptidase I [uncultured Eubacterium sp.]